nr:hypothetical protein [Bradyrhizobium neotropicale]
MRFIVPSSSAFQAQLCAPRLFARARALIETEYCKDVPAKPLANVGEGGRRNPVFAVFVFLDLLPADAHQRGNLRLRELILDPIVPELLRDDGVATTRATFAWWCGCSHIVPFLLADDSGYRNARSAGALSGVVEPWCFVRE